MMRKHGRVIIISIEINSSIDDAPSYLLREIASKFIEQSVDEKEIADDRDLATGDITIRPDLMA